MESNNKKIGLWEAVAMAVGTMIGASIFSIFGVGVKIAGENLPEAFVLSGIFALIVAYSYAKLGSKIISNAGPIAFILKGIGDNLVTGALAIIMWLSYVISISLFAKGFILLGFLQINPGYIIPSFSAKGLYGTLSAAVVFFLSYMGFGLITNASENMEDAEKNVPLAIFISIAIVMFVYIAVSFVAIGNLSIGELIKAQDNALAVAAKPFLGSFGFVLISIGAVFSISSALNATLYGGANIAYSFAKDGELPEFFERKVWFKSSEGLYITAALGLLFALTFNIGAIATIVSSIFTIIYVFVLISHYRLADNYGGNKGFILLNVIILLIVFLALIFYQYQTQRGAFYGTIITLLGALILEYVYRYLTKRRFIR
ncbi:MAG: APC family permease [Ignavibacteriaceae bacterium]